jgi:probable F420-dependent oxidoreductase
MTAGLSRVGIWSSQLGYADPDQFREVVRYLEDTGFASIWVPESTWVDPFVIAASILAATERITVATGVARIHGRAVQTMVNAWMGLSGWYPDRFVLGLGVSHRPAVERVLGRSYGSPVEEMTTYLDQLDAAPFSGLEVTGRRRVLAALGPKMLTLARDSADGAHPYMAPVDHTRFARDLLGPGSWLVPEIKVLFEPDAQAARAIARREIGQSLRLPNYSKNLTRFGFSADDVANAADSVIDALVAWGGDDEIATRIQSHVEAGADEVVCQVLSPHEQVPNAGWRHLKRILS